MELRRWASAWYSRRRRYRTAVVSAVVAGAGAAALAGLALASSPKTLSVARSVKVKNNAENIVVNARGMTVYTLSGETAHHLKCSSANGCFSVWFPVKAASARAPLSAGHGIKGRLGMVRRDGLHQVTLAGHPLYTFAGDGRRKGKATGDGLVSFGGTWHVIATSSVTTPAGTPTSPTPNDPTSSTTSTTTGSPAPPTTSATTTSPGTTTASDTTTSSATTTASTTTTTSTYTYPYP
jgi:predicted lipoprotein with Yx(FWY)xxD motif